jgi:putative transposase
MIISSQNGKWLVSILTGREVEQPVHPSTSAVGIDMGIVRFATLSTGKFIKPLNSFKKHEDRLLKAQQALSRKQRYSQNWKKAKAKVQRIHARIANPSPGLSAQAFYHHQQKPRDGCCRKPGR